MVNRLFEDLLALSIIQSMVPQQTRKSPPFPLVRHHRVSLWAWKREVSGLSDTLTLHQICHWDLRKRHVRSAEVLLPAGHVSIFMWVEISSSVPPPRYSASKNA